ncbi:MAG TPA: PEGA domain-containing protein [bacterium]|nr:PEGA domain-containing protein [bacterium]
MSLKKLVMLILLCLNSLLYSQAVDSSQIAVAILNFDANGVSQSEAKAISDRFRTELFQVGKYRVMERQEMERILDEMSFQLSGSTSSQNAVKAGRLVGVQKIVAGSVSKIDNFYSINTRLIDVETSQIENTATRDVQGSIADLLTDAIPELARELSGISGEDKRSSALKITTNPDSANIFLDNTFSGISPHKINLTPLDTHWIKIEKKGYQPWAHKYILDEKEERDVDIYLSKLETTKTGEQEEPLNAKVSIRTHPQDAKVFVNGNFLGLSPQEATLSSGDRHHLKITKENYKTQDQYYTFNKGENRSIEIYLSRKESPTRIAASQKSQEEQRNTGFHIRYTRLSIDKDINNYLGSLEGNLSEDNPFYEIIDDDLDEARIKNFSGLEFGNRIGASSFIGINFSIAIYRAEFNKWISGLFESPDSPDHDISFWNPQISADLQLEPFQFPLIHPFFNLGYGYNVLIMIPQEEGDSGKSLTFHAPGIYWGFGLEFKPFSGLGLAIDYNWRQMDMKVMETNSISKTFINSELDNFDMSSQNIGASIIFYY